MKRILFFLLVIIVSCAIIKPSLQTEISQSNILAISTLIDKYPDSIPKLALINLQNAISFNYQYQFKSDRPHNIWAAFKGLVVFPNQEQRQGEYIIEERKRNVMIKARGNYQYKIDEKTKRWRVLPRDEDTNLMLTIERAIANTRFYLIQQNNNSLTYGFRPNLAFLDPTFTRRISAVFVIDKKTLLPQKISARDSLEKILWRVEFNNYNTTKRIKFPFLPNTQINIASLEKLSKNEMNTIKKVLSKRLELTGENFQIKSRSERNRAVYEIAMEIPVSNPDYQLIKKLLTAPGKLNIYAATESIPLLNESNISDIKIISYEPYPQIELQLDQNGASLIKKYLEVSEVKPNFRVVLDATELAIFDIDKYGFSDRIVFRVLFNKNEIMNTIAILKGGLLSLPLAIIEIRSGR